MDIMTPNRHGVDSVLWPALSTIHNGFYIDVGAHNPEHASVTKIFYENGWKGINIEPIPRYYELLCQTRHRDINIKACISNKVGYQTFYEIINQDELSTLNCDIFQKYSAQHGGHVNQFQVRVETLSEIIKQQKIRNINFIRIDIVGYVENAIQSINLILYRPWIIVISNTHSNLDLSHHEMWESIILENNYQFALFDGNNRYYVANEHSKLVNRLRTHYQVNSFHNSKHLREHRKIAELESQIHIFSTEKSQIELLKNSLDQDKNRLETEKLMLLNENKILTQWKLDQLNSKAWKVVIIVRFISKSVRMALHLPKRFIHRIILSLKKITKIFFKKNVTFPLKLTYVNSFLLKYLQLFPNLKYRIKNEVFKDIYLSKHNIADPCSSLTSKKKMRIVLDLQGCQGLSLYRGIGHYSFSLARALIKNGSNHEFWLALNGRLQQNIEPLRTKFADLLPNERIRVFELPDSTDKRKTDTPEIIRENFLENIQPDIIHISSLFEGWNQDLFASIGNLDKTTPCAITFYDLIPYIYQKNMFEDEDHRLWYFRKLEYLKRAELLLTISESSRQEAIDLLDIPTDRVVNISSGIDSHFKPLRLPSSCYKDVLLRYRLKKPFLLYVTTPSENRKNVTTLLDAFVLLPEWIKQGYQLAIVGEINEHFLNTFYTLLTGLQLNSDQVIFTNYIPAQDLVILYNCCVLFVFPSLHEGLGLPALEAMACGAPTIGSDRSGISEIISRSDALFDPTKAHKIAAKIVQVLNDKSFANTLKNHGLARSKSYNWNNSARKTLEAFEELAKRKNNQLHKKIKIHPLINTPRLAYVWLQSSDKMAHSFHSDLLKGLGHYYDIEVIVDKSKITTKWKDMRYILRDINWFKSNADLYDRILYQLNFAFYEQGLLELSKKFPGVLILNDDLLGNIQHELSSQLINQEFLQYLTYKYYGYQALKSLRNKKTALANKYPMLLEALHNNHGIIVYSDYFKKIITDHYNNQGNKVVFKTSLPKIVIKGKSSYIKRIQLGFKKNDFIVCSFGNLSPTHLNHRLFEAWLKSVLAKQERCFLVFVSFEIDSAYEQSLLKKIKYARLNKHVRIIKSITQKLYYDYLNMADLAVQLQESTLGEINNTLLDCMAFGIPTLTNINLHDANLNSNIIARINNKFNNDTLTETLNVLYSNTPERKSIADLSQQYIKTYHNLNKISEHHWQIIEYFNQHSQIARDKKLWQYLLSNNLANADNQRDICKTVAKNQTCPAQKQLIIDVSELAKRDSKTGIQRVVRNILLNILNHPPDGFLVEPAYIKNGEFFYAREFTLKFLGIQNALFQDEPVKTKNIDIFLGLDLTCYDLLTTKNWLAHKRIHGIQLYFIIYDLLPLLQQQYFLFGLYPYFYDWLRTISTFSNGLICISKSVVNELESWFKSNPIERSTSLNLGYFHLGSDIANELKEKNSFDSISESAHFQTIFAKLEKETNVLMVGTVEPRKGHVQAISAFEQLWASGFHINLIIIGKQGWLVEALAERIRSHPEINVRLFWFDHVNDQDLEQFYKLSSLLLAASMSEGYGLPLIEASHYKLPILARDTPIFKEIAREHVMYFSGEQTQSLAYAIQNWLILAEQGQVPKSENISLLSWQQSTQRLKKLIFNCDNWHKTYLPNNN